MNTTILTLLVLSAFVMGCMCENPIGATFTTGGSKSVLMFDKCHATSANTWVHVNYTSFYAQYQTQSVIDIHTYRSSDCSSQMIFFVELNGVTPFTQQYLNIDGFTKQYTVDLAWPKMSVKDSIIMNIYDKNQFDTPSSYKILPNNSELFGSTVYCNAQGVPMQKKCAHIKVNNNGPKECVESPLKGLFTQNDVTLSFTCSDLSL
ncbi:hypothetical protein CYY_009318 [Polysphondylium violaceum]|uniref:Secreted protein n=1 Tax=Polysphondylium violaceum TaxID=133409 RepID=A0A8J4PNG0_9MYCE|nr:hypothetical protein CYY_009318 [Polysphondylium violaceum]